MLSPSVNAANGLLTQTFTETLNLDSYSNGARSIFVGKLPLDPPWLTPVRERVAMLAQAGAAWTMDKPAILGGVITAFVDYTSTFAGVAQAGGRLKGQPREIQTKTWIELLRDILLPALGAAVTATQTAETALIADYNKFKNVQPLLEDSINAGWQALADEEQQMVRIASELTHLQDVVEALAGKITGVEIASGKSIVSTTVTMLYNVATEVVGSFSFLSLATSVFTVGKSYYDIITDTEEIAETLQKIAALQLEASEEAQAAAGTKMILRLLYSLELSFGTISDVLPQVRTMWETEQQKVQALIEALEAGADPNNEFELLTVATANANWQAINAFAISLPTLKTDVGKPVTLNPQASAPQPA